MKMNVKKMACVSISLAMVFSACACSKKGSKKKSTGCQAAAEDVMDTLIGLKSKDIKKLGEFGEYEDAIDLITDDEFIAAVMEKATYEIDEDSVKEKKKEASCDVVVKVPDYEEAFEEADGDIDDFTDAIEEQKEKNYNEIELSLEFEIDDDEYTLTNGEDVLADLYGDMYDVLAEGAVSAPTTSPADPDPDPIDTPAPTDDDDPTTTTTANADYADLSFHSMTYAPMSYDLYLNAVSSTDDNASSNLQEEDPADYQDYGYENLTKYTYAWGDGYNNEYTYMEFSDMESAKKFFDDNCSYLSYVTDDYAVFDNYGYAVYVSDGWAFVYYWSDTVVIEGISMELDQTNAANLEKFFAALGII